MAVSRVAMRQASKPMKSKVQPASMSALLNTSSVMEPLGNFWS